MKREKLYKFLVVFLIVLQLVWFFTPWGFVYQGNTINALTWLGEDAILESRDFIIIYSNVVTVIYLVSCIGLLFYYKIAKITYTILVVFGGLTIPLFGLTVESGYESMLSYYMSIGDGIVLSMIYLTDISSNFEEK